MMLLHATAVVRDGLAVALTGRSGAGKSDLALRLIDRGWALLADDQLRLERAGETVIARAPATTRGLIEVRGLGIVEVAHVWEARLVLVVELGPERDRLPEPATATLLGIDVPLYRLDPRPASAAIRVEHAFARARAALRAGEP